MQATEKAYSFLYKNIVKAIVPVKNKIIRAKCDVHKFINNQSLIILKNDGHKNAYNLMSFYINNINKGVVWADQDLKSSNHFYNPNTNRGLYGNSNAKKESIFYYSKAINEYFYGDKNTAMFYLGVSCHLIQDLTVPQHANVRLLNNHRSYENWVIRMYENHNEFKITKGGIYLNSLKYYINLNSRKSISVYNKYSTEKNQDTKFYKITSIVLVLAQRTTAGLMYKFYYDIQKMAPIIEEKKRGDIRPPITS